MCWRCVVRLARVIVLVLTKIMIMPIIVLIIMLIIGTSPGHQVRPYRASKLRYLLG